MATNYIDLYSSSNYEEYTPHFELYVKPLGRQRRKRVELRQRLRSARILLKTRKPAKLVLSFFAESPFFSYTSTPFEEEADIPDGISSIQDASTGQYRPVYTELPEEPIDSDSIQFPSIDFLLGAAPLDSRIELELGYVDNFKKFGPFYVVNQEVVMSQSGGTDVRIEAQSFGIPSHASSFKVYSGGSYFSVLQTIFERSGFTVDEESFKQALELSNVYLYLEQKEKLDELRASADAYRNSGRPVPADIATDLEIVQRTLLNMEEGTASANRGRLRDYRETNTNTRTLTGAPVVDEDHPFVQIGESDYFAALRICDQLGLHLNLGSFKDYGRNPTVKFTSMFSADPDAVARLIYNPRGTDGPASNIKKIKFKTKKARPSAVRRRRYVTQITNAVSPVNPPTEEEEAPASSPVEASSSGLTPPEHRQLTLGDIETEDSRGRELPERKRAQLLALRQREADAEYAAGMAAYRDQLYERAADSPESSSPTRHTAEAESPNVEPLPDGSTVETRSETPTTIRKRIVVNARRAATLLGAELTMISGTPHLYPGQSVKLDTHSKIYSGDFKVESVEHEFSANLVFSTKVVLNRKRLVRRRPAEQQESPTPPEEPTNSGNAPVPPPAPTSSSTSE